MHNWNLNQIVNLHHLNERPKRKKEKKKQLVSIGLWQYHMILLITVDITKQTCLHFNMYFQFNM
jgi:hypothetical protein